MRFSDRHVGIAANLFLLVLAAVLGGCSLWASAPPGNAKQTTFGSFGPYKIASGRQLKEFNSAARAWFVERGFAPAADTTFSKIAAAAHGNPNAGKPWEGHGVLLCRQCAAVGRFYVFIPDYYYPSKSRIQLVGYYISLSGKSDEVLRWRHDFDATKAEFVARFPEDKVDPCEPGETIP